MRFNIRASILLTFIFFTLQSGKLFAEDFNYTSQSGSFSVLNSSYQNYMCNYYTINTGTSSPIVLMYTADLDPDDYLVIYSVDNNNQVIELEIVSGGSTSQVSGSVTTAYPNGKAYICFETDDVGSYSDMGYKGFTIHYATTSSMSQGQIYNYQGNTVLPGKVGIGTYNPGFALDVSGSTNISNDLFASGKVGIGTQTPATYLNIAGSTDLSPTTHGLMVVGATNTLNIGIDQNEIMARNSNGASTLYINHEGGNVLFNGSNTTGGNVGIGTVTPTSILSLGGTAARTIQMERNTTTSTSGQGLTLSSGGSTAGGTNLSGGDLTLKSGISTGTGTSSIRFLTATAGTTGTTDRAPSEKMTILGSGNVGIGTTNPLAKLDIKDGSLFLTDVDVAHGMTGYYNETNFGVLTPINGTAGGLNIYGISDSDVTGLKLNGTIGSATPASSTPVLSFNANKKSGTTVQALGATDMAFRFDNNSTPLMTVMGSGSVGIGTSTPSTLSKLDVRGNVYLNAGVDSTNIYWSGHQMIMGTPPDEYCHNVLTMRPGGSTSGELFSRIALWTAYSKTNKVNTIQLQSKGYSFLNGGNVGIGTIEPANLLDVRGVNSVTAGGHDIAAFANNLGTAGVVNGWYANGTAVTGGWTRSINYLPYYLGTSSAPQAITILNSGNVGIGTTTPDSYAMLTVNGVIHAKEVKIDLSGALADYVFEKNYNLKTLSEVHTYIKDNGHLPEIPSAEEVKKNGMDIADMQVKLLQKIEELTLYAIDQQKRIESLEKELMEVKNK